MPNIIPNAQLTAEDRASILRRYGSRGTTDHPWGEFARTMMGQPEATLDDQEWIDAHIWQRMADGSIWIVHE